MCNLSMTSPWNPCSIRSDNTTSNQRFCRQNHIIYTDRLYCISTTEQTCIELHILLRTICIPPSAVPVSQILKNVILKFWWPPLDTCSCRTHVRHRYLQSQDSSTWLDWLKSQCLEPLIGKLYEFHLPFLNVDESIDEMP